MEGLGAGIAIAFFILFGIVIWIVSMSMDKDRISAYVQQRGGRIVSINWAPFGRGWFGEKNDRIYEVVYYDRDGNQHWSTCKTSMLSGVYWTEDRISHHRANWYGGLPPQNDPGDPVIRHVPEPANGIQVEQDAAEALGLSTVDATAPDSVEQEIAQLKQRLQELERQQESRA